MKINTKKAFIDKIMLGFFLLSSTIIFVATVSDELKARNKYNELKRIVQTAALSASKYYTNVSNDENASQTIAIGIVSKTPLGDEVKNRIVFTWDLVSDPNNVKAKIENYKQDMFWYRLLGWDSFTFGPIEAKANIVILNPTDGFAPIAINGCNKTFEKGDQLKLLLGGYDDYTDDKFQHFFPLWTGEDHGHSQYVDWAKDGMGEFVDGSLDLTDDIINDFYSIAAGNTQAADVKQLANWMDMSSFSAMNASITILDCGSTKDTPIIKESIATKIQSIHCSEDEDLCCMFFICSPIFCVFDEIQQNWTGISWTTQESKCGKDYFQMDFEILDSNAKKIVLEY